MSERRSIREAALRGDLSRLKDLMRRWAGQAESGRLGWTALMTGSAKGQAEVVRFALDQERTDVNEKGEDGDTPLLRACFWGHCEVVELLLDRGADISLGTSIGYNALVTAAAAGRVRVVALILEKRKDDKELQASLTTALCMACGWGHRDVAKLLLEAGADYTHLNPEHFPVDTCLQLFEVSPISSSAQDPTPVASSGSKCLLALSRRVTSNPPRHYRSGTGGTTACTRRGACMTPQSAWPR
jgi:ankyrin repeat protein